MNEIVFTLKVDGKFKKAQLMSFTCKSLTLNVEGQIMTLNRTMFRVWTMHPEIDLQTVKLTMPSGREIICLN